MRCRRRVIRYCREKLLVPVITVPIVVASATTAKALTFDNVLLPLQKEANYEINRTLQPKSIPTVFICFRVLEIITVLAGAGVLTRGGYQLISDFVASRSQIRLQENLSERSSVTEVRETKVTEK